MREPRQDDIICPRCGATQFILIDYHDGFGEGCMDRDSCLLRMALKPKD